MTDQEETTELDDFLASMGIDTKPETPEEAFMSLIFNDEARKGTLSYYLRNELELLKAYHQHTNTMCTQSSLTNFLISHYLNTYISNHFRKLNADDVLPDKSIVLRLMCDHDYVRNVADLAWHREPRK